MSDARLGHSLPSSWRRWNMDELQQVRSSSPPPDHAEQRERQRQFEQQAELRALREQARAAAQQEGYEAGFAQGREEGYQQGLTEGRQTGEQQFESLRQERLAPLAVLASEFRQALNQLDDDIADTLVDLALATGRRLAGEAFDAHPEQVLARVRDLLHEEPLFSGQPRLWLHPDDLALIDDELTGELSAAGWKTQPDATLERGGCRVTGPEGELNASREARWEALLARTRRRSERAQDNKPEAQP